MRFGTVARLATLVMAGALMLPASGATMGAETPGPSPQNTPRPPGAWFFALEPGMCFNDAWTADGDFDFATLPDIVPCDEPHDNEVVAQLPMGGDAFPEGDQGPIVSELCAPEYEAFLGRPIQDSFLIPAEFWPDADDWAVGAQDVFCVVYAEERLIGSSRSGDLKAPGERIAVYREVDEDPDIWLLDAGTGELVTNLSDSSLTELLDIPTWRPDGSAVAFSAWVVADEADIYEVSLADGQVSRLLTLPGQQDGPAFSPDGTTLAWISPKDGAEYDIYTTDLATGEERRLTTYADRDSSPEWSPDGERLAFRRRTDDRNDIWVMNADGSDQQPLTADSGNNYDPRWSPDGSSILFSSNRGGSYDIWVMNADGSDQRPLTDHPADDEYPAWSSDGRFIAFQSDRYNGVTLWLMRADGSDQSLLADVAPVGWARFAPAGEG